MQGRAVVSVKTLNLPFVNYLTSRKFKSRCPNEPSPQYFFFAIFTIDLYVSTCEEVLINATSLYA